MTDPFRRPSNEEILATVADGRYPIWFEQTEEPIGFKCCTMVPKWWPQDKQDEARRAVEYHQKQLVDMMALTTGHMKQAKAVTLGTPEWAQEFGQGSRPSALPEQFGYFGLPETEVEG